MSIAGIQRILVFTWQTFWRNIWLSLVTISIITLAFVSINLLLFLNITTEAAIQGIQEKIDVSIYFRPDAEEAAVLEVKTFLSAVPEVEAVEYTSEFEALQRFRELHQNDPLILASLEELNDNPLGATLVVRAERIEDYPTILRLVEESKHNSIIADKNFDDHRTYIENLQRITANISRIGIGATLVFVLISLLIVFNTIRVALYTHRKEIGIMKLVGATNGFISAPFVLESIAYGLLSALAGIAILLSILRVVRPYLEAFFGPSFQQLSSAFAAQLWQVIGLEILVTTLLMILSSSIAIRRYLRV